MAIDKIQAAYKTAATLRNLTAEALKDGKFQWQEAFSFIPVLMELQTLVQNFKEMVEQMKAATHEERAQLEAYVVEQLGIPSAEMETFISDASDWILATIQLWNSGSDLRTVASTPS